MCNEDIKLDAGDVKVIPIAPADCPDCGDPATHTVSLDLRGNGRESTVFEGCYACAVEYATRLRASLPPEVQGVTAPSERAPQRR